ncbi:MAG: C1 family peptidase [Dysgonamonadaceae bacterium]|nr:C1 family peptidase [Dysgonamonadaceae bacterium]MDD4728000.1 C1 family peptidase [Dysgonamonadaceae bacterium]
MNKFFLVASVLLVSLFMQAQNDTEGYIFTVVKESPITSIKNQANSGTCWSFAGVSFLESELMRMGKGTHDLSEMYIVRRNYEDQAKKYARLHGSLNFSAGGSFADVVETIDDYGVIPENEYQGLMYGEENHKHGEIDHLLKGYMDAVIENKNKTLSPVWFKGYTGILDAYFGEVPANFTQEGKSYTPQSYAAELGLKSDNYISLSSFTHHDFYTTFPIEVPDNWRWAHSYNLPLDDFIEAMDHALMNGYTIAWATDVSEVGFSRSGIATVPDLDSSENAGSDQAHWLGLSANERSNEVRSKIGKEILKEKTITQEARQLGYDNYQTTDDHGMHIYGIAKDQQGNKYYMVKNSWGETGPYKGLWYASEAFVRYKTMNIVINKNALPKTIAAKLNVK